MGSEIGFSEDWLRQVGKELFQDRGTLMNLQEKFVKTILKKTLASSPKTRSRPGQVGCHDSAALSVPGVK